MTDRAKWLLAGGAAVLVLVGGVAIGLATGGDDDEITTETTSTSTTTAPTTPPTTVTDVTVGIVCSTPEEAAQGLYDSWVAGDQTAAKRCATDSAVGTMFQTNGAGAAYTFQGCYGTGEPTCAYSYEGGAVMFTLNGTENEGWKVVSVGYVAD